MAIRRIAGLFVLALAATIFSIQLASAHGNEDHSSTLQQQAVGSKIAHQHLLSRQAGMSAVEAQTSEQHEYRVDDGWCFYTCAPPAGVLPQMIFALILSGRILPGSPNPSLAGQDASRPRKPPRLRV